MSISGMTGFARAEGARGPVSWAWEVKSVNGRGLDVRVRMPSGLDALEPSAREAVQKRFKRGSVSLNLQVQREEAGASVRVNAEQLSAIIASARGFIEPGVVEPARLDGLLALRGVLGTDEAGADDAEEAALRADILATLMTALDALATARRAEGQALKSVLEEAIAGVERLQAAAAALSAVQPEAIRDRMRAKLDELMDGSFPEDRIAAEAAALAVKADVREELDRLTAHVATARELIASQEPTGRRLDFLAQEFNREANTLCSKSTDVELTRIGLDLKATIDQFREQVQNIE